ncbi:YdhR family protein [Rhodocaloribacter sp.]
MAAILFVRVQSHLDENELYRRVLERRGRFLEVPGLVQKIYGRDEATGAWCGVYFFEDQAALDAFRRSGLAQTIARVYEAYEVRPESHDVVFSLRPEKGPLAELP